MQRKLYSILVSLVLVVFLLAACTPAATPAPVKEPTTVPAATEAPTEVPVAAEAPTEAPAANEAPAVESGQLPEVVPADLKGDVYAAGSSTVYPLAEAIAENFKADGYTGQIKIDSIGSGGGFERFCKTGETDIANASRGIKDAEVENCKAINRTPVAFKVGLDAIAIVVNKDNDFLTDVTVDELGKIFSGDAEKWSDVNPDWPAEPIQRFVPGTDSGTFDFFVEFVLQKPRKIEKLDDAKKLALAAKNQQASEDDNVLVQGVEGSKYAIGYFGFAYFKNNEANLKTISIDGIAPSFETAESGEYLLSRPLYLYTDAQIMKDKPQVAGFINYFLANVDDVIGDVGYFPVSDEAMEASIQAWLDAVK
jgi:phosphate transport system substrate-binding protein